MTLEEKYLNITWEKESCKIFTGSEWQQGSASMIRAMKSGLDLAKININQGNDHIKCIDNLIKWLTDCLYSCNMENFNKKDLTF